MITDLIQRTKLGDDEAFFQLISSFKEQLYRIAYSYLKNEAEALEAIQETTCRAYQSLHKLKDTSYFKTWLIRILINYCIDEQKRKNRQVILSDQEEPQQEGLVEDQISIEAALQKIDARYRTVIRLKYFEDMTVKEIASVINCPEGTVKTRLHRGLEHLRGLLNRDGEFDA